MNWLLDEKHRAECEARYWLSKGYKTPSMIERLRESIRVKRGANAADKLINDMRTEYRKQLTDAKK